MGPSIKVRNKRNWTQSEETQMKSETVASKCSMDNIYHNRASPVFEKSGPNMNAIREIEMLHAHLDMVKEMVIPGCSEEMLNVALNSVSSLFNNLTFMVSGPRPHASL